MNGKTEFYTALPEDGGWKISAYTLPSLSRELLSELDISEADRIFMEDNLRSFKKGLFLLRCGRRAVIVSSYLYVSSRQLFAAAFEEPVDLILSLVDRGELPKIARAPSCEDKYKELKRISPKRSKAVSDAFKEFGTLALADGVIQETQAYSLCVALKEKALAAATLAGVTFDVEFKDVFGVTKNFDISFSAAFFISAAAYVRRAGVTRAGKLYFKSERERLFVILEVESLAHTSAFEFDTLKNIADEIGIGFFVSEEKGKIYAQMCAHRPELSALGLKDGIYLK